MKGEPAEVSHPAEPVTRKSAFWRFFGHPVMGIIGLVGTIASFISIFLAIYLYNAAKQQRQLTFYVHPAKATIVRTGEASRLAVTLDGRPITTDITAAQVAIWNQGRLAIRKSDILKPVAITTEGNAPILKATIQKASREVTQLALDLGDLKTGRVGINWDILEGGDGGIIQIIYAGDANLAVKVDGVIEGQREIERHVFLGKIKSASEQYESEKLSYLQPAVILLTVGLTMCGGMWFMNYSFWSLRKGNLHYQELKEETRRFWEDRKEHDRSRVEAINGFVADVERRLEQLDDRTADMGASELSSKREGHIQRIAEYRKEQQDAADRVKESEEQSEKASAASAESRKRGLESERLVTIVIRCGFAVGLASALIGLCLFFFAQPEGPPFGF